MNASSLPRTVRLAVYRPDGPDAAPERAALVAIGLTSGPATVSPGRHTVSWTWERAASDPTTLTIDHDLTNTDLACVIVIGPERVELAGRLAAALQCMPIELMHLAARHSPVADERRAALKLLGQVYATEDERSLADDVIAATLASARTDPDPTVRRDALVAEIAVDPVAAAAHIEVAATEAVDAADREVLHELAAIAGPAGRQVAPSSGHQESYVHIPGGALAIPTFGTYPIDDFVAQFTGIADVVERRTMPAPGGSAAVVEMVASGLDASITYAANTTVRLGCLYLTGHDRVVVATGTARSVRYFPMHLALLVAAHGRGSSRALALWAIAFASSRRMEPELELDPSVPSVIRSASSDSDPVVQGAALAAATLLHDELATLVGAEGAPSDATSGDAVGADRQDSDGQ